MIRKFLAVLICVLSALSFPMRASETGSWSMYGVFYEGSMQNIIDTERYLYYLSSGWLYAYDKENDENISYTELNDLSDTDISNIYYNYDNKYLLVVYANSNMDVIHEDGNVYNIPDLKNIVMSGSKKINSVDFRGDEAYVATDFGYVVVNMKNNSIKESFIYNKAITSIVALDKYIYICCDKSIYWSGIDDKHYQFSSFQPVNNFVNKETFSFYKIDGLNFLMKGGWIYRAHITSQPNELLIGTIQQQICGPISRTKTGLIVPNKTYYYLLDAKGSNKVQVNLPAEIDGTYLSSYAGDGSFWNVDLNGVKQVKLENGQTTVLHDNFRPNMPTVDQHYLMDMKGNTLTTANSGPNGLGVNKVDNYAVRLNSFKDGKWINQLPQEYATGTTKLYRSISLALEPKDPSSIWLGTWGKGLYNFKNRELVKTWNETNSLLTKNSLICDLDFDNKGNLWMLHFNSNNISDNHLYMIPADKLDSDNTDSWVKFNFGSIKIDYFGKMYVDDHYAAFATSVWTSSLCIVDYNATPTDTSDDRQTIVSSFVDQDGRRFEIGYIYCMKKDIDGRIWIGTNTGVGIINDLGDAFDGQLVVNRIKVPRNDGTNLADYLLDGLVVTSLDFDGANRKWVGTQTSGLYLISADGSEILANYNVDNSTITDNEIGSVICDRSSNNVYIGTRKGLFIYSSDAVWAAPNYSNVYAYPNPIRPEYAGPVTITGLMDNSLVKIADAAGNVIYSGYSNGGMFVWNLTNMQGSHINTGVYYVLASQSVDGSKDGCVSKILVVR